MNIGRKLKKLRGKRSKREVAEALGVSFSSYVKYERNERVPRDEVKIKIASLYNQSVQDIFFSHSEHI